MNITECLVRDETGSAKIIWFNQPFIARNLRTGDRVSLSGKVEDDYGGAMLLSPIYEKVSNGGNVHTQGLVPNYHLTSQLTQKQIRFFIKLVIGLTRQVVDWLPAEIRQDLKLLDIGDALNKIHFPQNQDDINQAKRRLGFNELFLIQLQSQMIRRDASRQVAAPVLFKEKETKEFVAN